ncbi:unnamed protein product [Angiostrongylus costaricensis]|uniref:Peptidase S28 n=1 Tax=Angiostrongylus costaricensis TaxID=334426 RepID=A0A0R3Q210_ANGCS|nr:unnamed protein product [Angiostrongylus costaricensis]
MLALFAFFHVYSEAATSFMHFRDPNVWSPLHQLDETNNIHKRSAYKWTEEWFDDVPVDHFSFANRDNFKLRYFLNIENYKAGGAIFFYTGNEGNLESFAINTKLIGAQKSPVIAFGGSYGGMLAAWIRIKYPHKVDGAIASSALVFWFIDSKIPADIYDKIVTRSFMAAGCNRKAIEKGWVAMRNLAQTAYGRSYLNELFHLEKKSRLTSEEDYKFLSNYIKDVFEIMARVNYPYPSNFLTALPSWPVKVVNLYYNYTGTTKSLCANPSFCSRFAAALGDPLGWPWQYCTEMVMPQCSSGWPNDFFWESCPFTVQGAIDECKVWYASKNAVH